VRFRLRDWQDCSVVNVPDWIIGDTGLEDAEPELAKRVYFDLDDLSRMDCVIGLVARIARLKEEKSSKKNRNDNLMKKLKKDLTSDELQKGRICFNNVKKEQVFKNFITRIKENRKNCQIKADSWKKYFDFMETILGKNLKNNTFLLKALGSKAPWTQEKNRQQKKTQWNQLFEKLREYSNNPQEEFLKHIKGTYERYQRLSDQWGKYHNHAINSKCEIAVPVVAFNTFLGVLNFHREKAFTEKDEKIAKVFAAQLAVACLQRQTELFDDFQKVIQVMAAKSNFEEIASKIAEGIRIGLQDGLKANEVFPLLYVAIQPITRFDDLSDEDFSKRWINAYHKRQEPPKDTDDHHVWEIENKLGNIPIT